MDVHANAPVSAERAHLDERGARYEILEELGRGGMGEVHSAFDRRIGRLVAVKRCRRSGDAAVDVERFLREACVQGQLEHPTVVPLYDIEVAGDGEISFTMKRVRGRTLKAILSALQAGDREADERYPTHKLLADFATVCLGVAFAHSRGVLHRDLKPENVMLGEFGEVYVLDWGVAKIGNAKEGAAGDALLVPGTTQATVSGSLIGTPGYMAPEQCRGQIELVGPRSDVYALGAILFEISRSSPCSRSTEATPLSASRRPFAAATCRRACLPSSRACAGAPLPSPLRSVCPRCARCTTG